MDTKERELKVKVNYFCFAALAHNMEDKSSSNISDSKIAGLFGGQNLAKTYQKWLQLEVVALSFVMVIVWGLLMLPIVFYYHPIPVEVHNYVLFVIKNVRME